MSACWVPFRSNRFAAAMLPLVLISCAAIAEEEQATFFETQIRPILREYCFDCHGATQEMEGGLDLRLVRFIKSGGDSGTALEPGDPEASLLLTRVRDGDMPPGEARVSDDKIAILEKWIANGAATLRPEPEQIGPGIPITEEERNYWAYQPIAAPQPAVPQDRGTIRTPIDALLAAAMPEGLSFSPDADRFTVIQRLFNDLIGLPPTAEQVDQWMQNADPDWYEQLVEELLRSPHYGERWARHWLDAAGYADSDGYTVKDSGRDWAWRYRDYVIRSFNDDKPFDRFITEQIAGDELAGPAEGDWTEQQIDLLTATGFLRMAADGTGSGDNSAEARNKTIADTMQIVCSTLLGSSVHCAQCHDHRYDPISHVDYFALRSVFEPALDWKAWKAPAARLVSLYTAADRADAAKIEEEVQVVAKERAEKQAAFIQEVFEEELLKFEDPLRSQLRDAYNTAKDKRTDDQKKLLAANPAINITAGVLYQYRPEAAKELKEIDKRIADMRAKKPVEEFIHALVEAPNHAPVTHLFYRGDFNQPKQEVQPAGLTVVAPEGRVAQFPANDPNLPTSGRRLAFAGWVTDAANNPLTPRAIVNRVWLHHFGRGIVSTPGDFGRLGGEPTHPELLDWLANDFVQHGWSLKHLHRQILTSTAWRQSSYREPTREAIDSDNHYYWRKSLQRIDAEILRDSILAVSGNLDVDQFGPPVDIAEDETGQVRVDEKKPRRSIYVRARRSQPVGMLQTFDAPVMSVNCDIRSVSTVAPQSLMMLNGEFILDQAERVAQRAVELEAARRSDSATEAAVPTWLPAAPAPTWQYGTGTVDEAAGLLQDFQPLPHFDGSRWQGAETVPSPGSGWAFLTKTGGHPGNPKYPTVRRWIAPRDGRLSIAGSLQHSSENGDGVRGRVLSAGGLRGSWNALHNSAPTDVVAFDVAGGEAIDMVTDCLKNESSDSYSWTVKLTFTPSDGSAHVYDSAADFRGPAEDLSRLPAQIAASWQIVLSRAPSEAEQKTVAQFVNRQLTQLFDDPEGTLKDKTPGRQVLINLCQMLINSNEFLYIE